MSSNDLSAQNGQIDPFTDSLKNLLVIVFSKSNSQNFALALNIAKGAEKFNEAVIDGKSTYSVCFGNSQSDAARALAFLGYASSWKGVQIFSKGIMLSSIYCIQGVLECYIKSQSCKDFRAYCYKVIDDPLNTELETVGSMTLSIKFEKIPPIKKKIDVDTYVFPCKRLHHQFKLQPNHPSSIKHQIQALAVDSGCDWCPNFNADSWEKVGTKTVLKEFFS